ncbi:MAG: hypothetical protein ACOYL5_06155 [Phototrophicaceae bacterium]|jgi:hypothetical protein
MTESPPVTPEVIPPQQARAALRAKITATLGEQWDSPDSAWRIVTYHDYMARLNRGRHNVDFYVDYFNAEVRVESSEIHQGQETGWLFAWMFLSAVALIILLIARIVGWV